MLAVGHYRSSDKEILQLAADDGNLSAQLLIASIDFISKRSAAQK